MAKNNKKIGNYFCIRCQRAFRQKPIRKNDYTARCPKCHKGIYVVLKEHPLVSNKTEVAK